MKRAEHQPFGAVHLYGDVFVKEMRVQDVGTVIPQHAHTYDHISYLAAGKVIVEHRTPNGSEIVTKVYAAPACIRIPARVKHKFITAEPDVLVLCIHNAAHGEAADIAEEHHLDLEP